MLTRHYRREEMVLARSNITVDIPYENFVGAVLDGCFRVQGLKLQGDHLDIYSVTDLRQPGHATFEAQAFPLSFPAGKLLKVRGRRLKRIARSRSFQCAFTWAGRRFFVSDVARSEAEWRNLAAQEYAHAGGGESEREDFPPLPSKLSPDGSSRSLNPVFVGSSGYSNYAEAARGRQSDGHRSTTGKGIRQRRRRERRRKEKALRNLCQ